MLLLVLTLLCAQADEEEEGFGGAPSAAVVAAKNQLAREASEEVKAALRRRIAEDKVRSHFLQKEEASILGGLGEIDRGLERQRKKAAQLQETRIKLEKEIARVDAELAQNEGRLAVLREKIGRRAAAMFKLKRTPLGDLLAKAHSPVEMRKLRDRLRLILSFDAKLVAETREAGASAIRLREELGTREGALDAARAEIDAEIEKGLQLREDRAALLRAIQGERGMIEKLAHEIAQAARKLDEEVGVVHGATPAPEPAAGGFERQKGRLPWPVAGRVEVPFGKRVDPGSGMVMVQKGIDLRAPLAEPVRAVFGGTVAFSDWLQGFGRVVVLDHGDGWYSVYGHLESAEVRKGMSVNQYQVVGFVGDSDSLKGPYLYLEIRQGKTAVDPMAWLAR